MTNPVQPAGAKRLQRHARTVLVLNALYNLADALCSVFVGVYFLIHSLSFQVVCMHYLALYVVTPVAFLAAGWYAQARDRTHVYRLGLLLHAVYYGLLLSLQERAVEYPVAVGALLGVTWGFFWAGNNTFAYDVTQGQGREYFFGWLSSVIGTARLVAPLLSGVIIRFAADTPFDGYTVIFFLSVLLFALGISVSFLIPPDKERRPFRIRRALFPGRDQRDWRWVMAAAFSLAGTFNIFYFLLGILMYQATTDELSVGGFTAFQGLIAVVTSYLVGRIVVPRNRRVSMRWGAVLLFLGGLAILVHFSVYTVVFLGFMRAVARPMFSIPHFGLRYDVIGQSAADPAQRIEYLCAWEIPLALGRVVMMLILIAMSSWLDEFGIRLCIFLLCANRFITYACLCQVSTMRTAPP